jgi:hypothetical protein
LAYCTIVITSWTDRRLQHGHGHSDNIPAVVDGELFQGRRIESKRPAQLRNPFQRSLAGSSLSHPRARAWIKAENDAARGHGGGLEKRATQYALAHGSLPDWFRCRQTPNARHELRLEAEATQERTLEAVSPTPLFGLVMDRNLCPASWF